MGLLGVTRTNQRMNECDRHKTSKHAADQVNEWWSDLNYATLPLMCQCDDTKHIVSFPIFPCLIIHIYMHLTFRSIFNKTLTHVSAHYTHSHTHILELTHNWFNRYSIQHFVTYCNYIFYLIHAGFSKILFVFCVQYHQPNILNYRWKWCVLSFLLFYLARIFGA